MFEIIKEKVSFEQVFLDIVKVPLKEAGEWAEPEDAECPFCKHRDCFKVTPERDGWYCFSEDTGGDVISFVAKAYGVSQLEAAQAIAKQYSIEVPSSYSVVREIYRLAMEYYHAALMEDTHEYTELGGRTPKDYQIHVRGHSEEMIERFKLGWSDGGVIDYLRGVGFEDEILETTGLLSKKKSDFLPRNSFIYPHFVGGAVGHFTFKDPKKALEYQVAKKFRHQNWGFYNQNSVKGAHTVIVVEGENDVISTAEKAPEGYGVIGCIGMISGEQLAWIRDNCSDKEVISVFDPDEAGGKYQAKLSKLKGEVLVLKQVSLPPSTDPSVKAADIDDILRAGGNLLEILSTARVDSQEGQKPVVEMKGEDGETIEVEVSSDSSGAGTVVEHARAYYRVKYKDGAPSKYKLTNFVIQLKNIYIQSDRREREVVFVREDGKRSRPVKVTSEVKVSLKSFKSLVANAVDGSFYGREDDLAILWDFVYQGVDEKEVYLPNLVGHLREFKGWLFQDCFVGDDGSLSKMGDDGVIWVGGSASSGIKPVALTEEGERKDNIPEMVTDLDRESRKELERGFVENFALNLGDVGVALIALAWAKSCAYSDRIFDWRRDFPFLFLWGRHGRGKTYVAKWLAGLYGTAECGYTTISGMQRSVGFYRKLAYYASLPVVIDEIRADKNTSEMYGTFRAWYQRSGRTLGTKEEFGIREQRVVSTFIFAGQDQFSDGALRQRCIPIRIPITNRELEETFRWIEGRRHDLPAIGLEWILESSKVDFSQMVDRIQVLNTELREAGCPQRTSLNWALIAEFGAGIAEEYFPSFDFLGYIKQASAIDSAEQESEDVLAQFFQVVEGLQAAENARITGAHVSLTEPEVLSVWINEVFRIVEKELSGSAREEFSKKAILELLKEEPWCIHTDSNGAQPRARMGDGIQRRVYKFNLETAPEYIKVLGDYNVQRQ